MSTIAELITLARDMGYEGERLQKFVDDEKTELKRKEDLAREERRIEREIKKEEAERIERENERRHALEMAKVTSEAARINDNRPKTETRLNTSEIMSKIPKLIPFSPNKGDQMDAYIFRFEMLVKSYNWSDETKFVALSNLLTGDALQVLQTLTEMQQTYDCLKSALLKRYLCTESGYNKKFRDAVPFAQEDIDTFISRTETLFGKWVELAGIENGDFNSLRDLMLRDQLYRSLHSDLVTFLKERSPKSLKEVREIANRYVTAYPDRSIAKDHNSANLALKPIHANLDNKQSREYSENQRGRLQNQRSNSCGFEHNGDNRHYQQNLKKQYPRDQSRWYKYSDRYSQGRHHQRGFYNDRPYNMGQNRNNYANYASTVLANTGVTNQNKGLTFFSGTVNEHVCTMIRDTGVSCVGIRRDLLKEKDFTGETETCIMFDGTQTELELAYAYIDTPFYVGRVKAFALKNPVAGIILGNITGVKDYPLVPKTDDKRDEYDDTENKAFAVTRSTSKSDNSDEKSCNSDDNVKELTTKTSSTTIPDSHDKVPIDFVDITSIKFRVEQQSDDSLCSIKEKAAKEDGFFIKDGLIYRRARNGKSHDQLVVPTTLRQSVLKCCHDNQTAGHMGVSATKKRICSRFSWPGIMADIKQYVRSCDICQRHCNTLPRLPIEQADFISKPFDKVDIDIVGPLPMTQSKSRYILTFIDVSTRWPEAVPLKDIKTTDVANALFTIFTRLGIPKQILSDNGQQLVSNAMKEVLSMMGIDHRQSSAYHSQSNGMIERQNGTLKNMLHKLTSDKPNTWDQLLPAVLFAYREVPNTSTGYPPFTLMFGRDVRGPASVLADIFAGNSDTSEEYIFVHDYVRELRGTIKEACEIAAENAERQLKRHREYKNEHTRYREFAKGDKVLILLPKDGNNLFMRYQGPFIIETVSNNNNYVFRIGNKLKRYHANLLKKYVERTPTPPHDIISPSACVAYIEEEFCADAGSNLEFRQTVQKEFPCNATINHELSLEQQHQAKEVLEQFPDTLSDVPGQATILEHKIRLTDHTPFRVKQYPIPAHAHEAVDKEIDNMLACGVISPSNSPYSSPITIVNKKDKSIRLCLDFRRLNSITIFDAEPIPTLHDLLLKLKGAKYFTKFDLTKGYWQIPLAKESKAYTAFQTNRGLMEFNYMPFGLSTASCTFQKAMKCILGSLPFVISYFDDVLIFSETWEEHLRHIKETLETLHDANLTVKPSKTNVGCSSVDFLGHVVSAGSIRPDKAKTQKIMDIEPPTTKKQTRRILGLMSYYRTFVPNFSTIAQPLTDITRKKSSNKVQWTEECQKSLDKIKDILTTEPILRVPDLSKPFIVQSNAST